MNITAFWDVHYRIEDDELRVMIAQVITDEYEARGWRGRLFTRRYRHPMTRRKDYARSYSILDILADFIIKAEMKTEKKADYPVPNREVDLYRERMRKKREIPLEWTDENGDIAGPITTLGVDGRDWRPPVRHAR